MPNMNENVMLNEKVREKFIKDFQKRCEDEVMDAILGFRIIDADYEVLKPEFKYLEQN